MKIINKFFNDGKRLVNVRTDDGKILVMEEIDFWVNQLENKIPVGTSSYKEIIKVILKEIDFLKLKQQSENINKPTLQPYPNNTPWITPSVKFTEPDNFRTYTID